MIGQKTDAACVVAGNETDGFPSGYFSTDWSSEIVAAAENGTMEAEYTITDFHGNSSGSGQEWTVTNYNFCVP